MWYERCDDLCAKKKSSRIFLPAHQNDRIFQVMCTTTHSCLNSYGRFWLFSYLCTIRDGSGQNPTWGHFGQPDPNNFSMNPSNPRYNFVQPERPESNNSFIWHPLLHHFCQWFLHSLLHHLLILLFFAKFSQHWLKNEKKTWPEFDPNQISMTRAE